MKLSDIPASIPTPFGSAAGGSFIRPIPATSQIGIQNGAASWPTGFVPLNFLPVDAGGVPPFGEDMNGVLNAISAWSQWIDSGSPVPYNGTYQTTIGGYPQGALLLAATADHWWLSTADDNLTDPDTGGAGWLPFGPMKSWAGNPNGHLSGIAASGSGAPTVAFDTAEGSFWVCTTTGNAAAAAWTPLAAQFQINPSVTGNGRAYGAADNGKVRVRSNAGTAMTDTLPAKATVPDGWNVKVINSDATAADTIAAPAGTSLNGTDAGFIVLASGQSAEFGADSSGNLWVTQTPVPRVLGQELAPVNSSGSVGPGAYAVDTSAGAITLLLMASPSLGDNYQFTDVTGSWRAKPLTINFNGKTFRGSLANLTCNVAGESLLINWLAAKNDYRSF